jgi:UDP-2,4-diacetamido-2,4,6-trideoxy-beta-L-altropyranose hydrolase
VKYVVRVNSSARIGTGHVVRSLALAERLRQAGGEVAFVVRPLPGGIDDAIAAQGYPVTPLAAQATDEERHPWLGVPPEREIEESLRALRAGGRVDWLIVDSYGLGAPWERAMRAHAGGIFAVDDLADRAHDVDGLLDQSAGPDETRRYHALVPPSARLFMGPRYLQLREQFAKQRTTLRERDGTIRRVLVAFGTEPGYNTALALEVLAAVDPGTLEVSVVLAEGAPGFARVRALVALRPRWTLHPYVEAMAELMADCDLAIGAGGTSAYERAAVGLPAVAWAIAENQRGVIRGLERAGAIVVPDDDDRAREPHLRRVVAELLTDRIRVRALAQAALAAMSGWEDGVRDLIGFLARTPVAVPDAAGAGR